jgi:hypothetical protein
MKKFINWVISFGAKAVINLLKSKVDVLAKMMSDSVDIPFVSEENEKKEAKKAINAIVAAIEELCEKELKEKK